MDIVDVIRWIAAAWDNVEPIIVVRSWKKLLDHRATHEWWEQDGEKDVRVEN